MDPISAAALTTTALKTAASNAGLLIEAAQWIYKAVTDRRPLIDKGSDPNYQDKTRYDRLCNLRRECSGTVPKEWELDETNRPKNEVQFSENAKNLRRYVEGLEERTYPQKQIVIGLLAQIETIFISLNNNKAQLTTFLQETFYPWTGYRSDGFEAMFYGDLAIWLSSELPGYDIRDPATAKLLEKWIKYCLDVHHNVLMFRNDESKPNSPKDSLVLIIKNLEILHANICKANKAAGFNEKLELIERRFLTIAENTFDFIYFLNEHLTAAYPPKIQVQLLINHAHPQDNHRLDANITKLVKSLIGQWLVKTLDIARIASNDFENHELIDLPLIDNHLNIDLSGITNLKTTGLWSFARQNKNKTKEYLLDIIQILRLLLRLYFVKESIVLCAFVSKELGQAWIYGEDTGQEIVEVLLAVIQDAQHQLYQTIEIFWNKFYHIDFQIEAHKLDNRSPVYQFLGNANTSVRRIKENTIEIQKLLDIIRSQCNSGATETITILNKIKRLKVNLYSY